jgi:hypothetical protein
MYNTTNKVALRHTQIKEELSTTEVKFLAHNLKLINVDTNLRLSCSVCLEDFDDDSKISKLKCRHVYHSYCLKQLIIKAENQVCAICRQDIEVIDTLDSPISLINNCTLKCTEDRCFYFSTLDKMYDFYLMINNFTGYFSELFNNNHNIKLDKLSIIKGAYTIFNKHCSNLSLPHVKKPEEDATQQAMLCPYPEKLFEGSPLETFFGLHSTFLCSYISNSLKYYLPNISILKTSINLKLKSMSVSIAYNTINYLKLGYCLEKLSERCNTTMFLMHSVSKKIINDVIVIKLILKYNALSASNKNLSILASDNNGVLSFKYLDYEYRFDIYMSDFVDYNTLEINDSKFKSMLHLQGVDIDKVGL